MLSPKHLLIAVLVSVVFALAGSAFATSALFLDLPSHLRDSTAVVDARVLDSSQVIDPQSGLPYTTTVLQVDRVLWGSAPAQIGIRQMRGMRGEEYHQLAGDGKLEQGKRVVVFARRWDKDGNWYLAALAQSVYHVEGTGSDPAIRRDLGGLHLMERGPGGAIVEAESTTEYKTLGALEAALAQLSRRP